MDNKELLKNLVQQKFVKIAQRARIKFEDGKSAESEFCCLMRLHSLYIALCDLPNPTLEQLKDFETLANSICGRTRFIFQPMDWCGLDFETDSPAPEVPISACDISYSNPALPTDQNTVCKALDKIVDILNYEHPWIQFTVKSGLPAGKYEIGEGTGLTVVGTTVNKTALNTYQIDRNGSVVQYARELKNAIPDQSLNLDFQTASAQQFILKGEYRDIERFQNQNIKAEAELKWESVWPVYYGVGPLTALDDPAQREAFIRSLQKVLSPTSCYKIDIPAGMVLYYFFPFTGMKREFKSENGIMRGSYKGTISGVRTQSMINNNIAGGQTYGVIRTDQPGIRFFDFCVVDFELETEEVSVPVVQIVQPQLAYEGFWTELECVKEEN
jgi:hypothetical protein